MISTVTAPTRCKRIRPTGSTRNHTLRAGISFQQEHAIFNNNLSGLPRRCRRHTSSPIRPFNVPDSSSKTGYLYSAYVQDEWKLTDKLTVNYGLRYDKMDEYVSASQLSPRVGLVYTLTPSTTVHAGYSRTSHAARVRACIGRRYRALRWYDCPDIDPERSGAAGTQRLFRSWRHAAA